MNTYEELLDILVEFSKFQITLWKFSENEDYIYFREYFFFNEQIIFRTFELDIDEKSEFIQEVQALEIFLDDKVIENSDDLDQELVDAIEDDLIESIEEAEPLIDSEEALQYVKQEDIQVKSYDRTSSLEEVILESITMQIDNDEWSVEFIYN